MQIQVKCGKLAFFTLVNYLQSFKVTQLYCAFLNILSLQKKEMRYGNMVTFDWSSIKFCLNVCTYFYCQDYNILQTKNMILHLKSNYTSFLFNHKILELPLLHCVNVNRQKEKPTNINENVFFHVNFSWECFERISENYS